MIWSGAGCMKLQNESIQRELEVLRTGAGIVRGVFGALELRGSESLDLVHRLTTNDVRNLQTGRGAWTVFTDERGRVIDVSIVLPSPEGVMLLCSKGNEAPLTSWISRFVITEEIEILNASRSSNSSCLIGPQTISRFQSSGLDITWDARASIRTFDTEFGLVVLLRGNPFADAIVLSGDGLEGVRRISETGVPVISEAGYETYRIARGTPRLGYEIRSAFNPFEIGLRNAISFTKGCYVGQEVVARLETYGKVRRKLVGLEIDASEGSVNPEEELYDDAGELGVVTSVSPASVNGCLRALAVIRINEARSTGTVFTGSPGGSAARIVDLNERESRS